MAEKEKQAPAKKAPAKDAGKPQTAKALKVTCDKDGFWRGGIQWFKEPKTIPLDAIDNKQLALITAEKRLAVEHVDIPAAAEG